MHQDMISSPQGTTASGRQLDQFEPRVSDEAETRSHSETIRSHSRSNSVLQSDLDPVLASVPSPASNAASETSIHPAFSEQTGSTIEPPPSSFLGRFRGLKDTWRVPAAILGFYFISFLCAVAHYCFFAYLDGRIISPGFMLSTKTTTVPQAYATTVSLVLVTAFRAALVASIGTCYTQYLCATFRKSMLKAPFFPVSLIEDLFQLHTNPIRLLNYHLYFKTPILVAMAIFCWLVPIATVYPPGTLIVGIQPSSIDTSFNVSVFHHRNLRDILEGNVIAPIACPFNCTDQGCYYRPPSVSEVVENVTSLEGCSSSGISSRMEYITRSNLIVGEISSLKQASKDNASYELSFFGTTLGCEIRNHSIETIISELIYEPRVGSKPWKIQYPESTCLLENNIGPDGSFDDVSIIYRLPRYKHSRRYWPCLDKDRWIPTIDDSQGSHSQRVNLLGSGIHIIVPVTETVCRPKIVRYHVTISNTGGAQHVSFVSEDDKSIPPYHDIFSRFNGSLEQWANLSDAVRIYDDFASNFKQSGYLYSSSDFEYPSKPNRTQPYTTSNGTIVETCVLEADILLEPRFPDSSYDIWPLGVFEQRLHGNNTYYECPAFDPDMANELLINTTISALSLNERFDMVNGTETRSFNVYRFENKLAFFLPYGLSLALTIPILALGFVALYSQNHGVSAITGGFLQLLMTTTGRNSLEAVVTKGSGTLGGYENVSKELYEMEVRFGELIEGSGDDIMETDTLLSGHEGGTNVQEDDGTQSGVETMSGTEWCEKSVSVVRRAGFGTVHEVGLFRKKGE